MNLGDDAAHAAAPGPGVRIAGRARLALAAAAAFAAVLAAAVAMMPVRSPRAASGDETPAAASGTNFGSATPSDKYVQEFQQQVSQQLQSALVQANESQENRLHAFEQQQRRLEDQLRAIEQSVVAGAMTGSGQGGGPGGTGDFDPPKVNARRARAPDLAREAAPPGLGALLTGGLGVPSDIAGDAASDASAPAAPAVSPYLDRGASAAAAMPVRAGRSGEANIAPHGFVEGRLLNGVVAVQGGPDRDSIVALSGNYQSANGFVSNLDGCMALVQAKPEIATGRIDFKLSRLTCNFTDGASRTWDAAGWLVDADGIRGVRATIVDNTARKAGVAAAGGAVGGLGQRLSQQQYEVNAGPAGFGSSSTFVGNPLRDALGGAGTGAANALGQSIADYYNLYTPSLQVGGGTAVTVVLANDLRLPASGREITQTHTATP